jgi:hypothetical protein
MNATVHATTIIRGISYAFSFRALRSYPFFVSVGLARNDTLAGWRVRSILVGALGLLLLLILAGLLYRLWRADEERSVLKISF